MRAIADMLDDMGALSDLAIGEGQLVTGDRIEELRIELAEAFDAIPKGARQSTKRKGEGSKQDYRTPRAFLDAVERRFGRITFDLACTKEDAVSPHGFFHPEYDALAISPDRWARATEGGLGFLNPPFRNIHLWAAACSVAVPHLNAIGGRIAMLIPAAVGTVYYAHHIHGRALVLPLSPRLVFQGMAEPFPKDLMLCVYGVGADERQLEIPGCESPRTLPGFEPWRWDGKVAA